jgi:hypothetical protein
MKQYILKFVALGLCAGLAVALPTKSSGQDVGSIAKQAQGMGAMGNMGSISGLVQNLKLTPAQVQQVLPILQSEVPKLQKIMGNKGLSGPQKQAQTKAVQQQSDSRLKTMLNPDQLMKLKDFRSVQTKDLLQGVIPQ